MQSLKKLAEKLSNVGMAVDLRQLVEKAYIRTAPGRGKGSFVHIETTEGCINLFASEEDEAELWAIATIINKLRAKEAQRSFADHLGDEQAANQLKAVS